MRTYASEPNNYSKFLEHLQNSTLHPVKEEKKEEEPEESDEDMGFGLFD